MSRTFGLTTRQKIVIHGNERRGRPRATINREIREAHYINDLEERNRQKVHGKSSAEHDNGGWGDNSWR